MGASSRMGAVDAVVLPELSREYHDAIPEATNRQDSVTECKACSKSKSPQMTTLKAYSNIWGSGG